MSRYTAQDDPLCYPGTHVLKNKAGIRDQNELEQFENLMFLTRAEENLPDGNFDYAHYKKIHHHFFQDVYDWAGRKRQIRTGKGGNWFCYPEYIDPQMEKLFDELAKENQLTGIDDPDVFSGRAAYYISEINAIHPFREGNGRCQLTFLTMLLRLSGWDLDENRLDPDRFMKAMIASFIGDNNLLAREIRTLIKDAE